MRHLAWADCVKVTAFLEKLGLGYFGFISGFQEAFFFFWVSNSKADLPENQPQRAWRCGVGWVRWPASRSLQGWMLMGSSRWLWRLRGRLRGTGRPVSCWHAVQGWSGTFCSSSKGHNWCSTWRRGTQWSSCRRLFGTHTFSSHPVVIVATCIASVWDGTSLISSVRCRMRSLSTSNFSPLLALSTTRAIGSGFWAELVLCVQGYGFHLAKLSKFFFTDFVGHWLAYWSYDITQLKVSRSCNCWNLYRLKLKYNSKELI